MLFGKKKVPVPQTGQADDEQVKTAPFDINDEVVFHIMPSRFKKINADAKQAQKTGMMIMVIAILFIIGLTAALAWYFLLGKKELANTQSSVALIDQEQPATTSAQEMKTLQSAPELVATTVPEAGNMQIAETEVVASGTPATSTSETAATSTVATLTNPAPLSIASAADTDGDGLSDPEEALLGTSPERADTDNDGFSDLAELEKGYNPAGPGKINQAKVFGVFDNSNFNLSYPMVWQFSSTGNDSVIFHTKDEQMVSISLQPNIKNQSISSWFKEQFGNQTVENDQLLTKVWPDGNEEWQGILSPNRLTAYLTDSKKQTIVSINYDLGFSSKLNYKQLFSYMINSFNLKD